MPLSVCLELTTSGERTVPPCARRAALPWDMSQETQRSAGCSEIKAVMDKEARLKRQVQFGFLGRVYLKKQLLLKEACSGTNDKATKPFRLRLKGEAARHKEVSLCDLPWGKRLARPPAPCPSPLTSAGQFINARRTRMTRIAPRSGSRLQRCGASQQPHVF